eukprot:356621-Chlamydomonas_euryale.AAC.4
MQPQATAAEGPLALRSQADMSARAEPAAGTTPGTLAGRGPGMSTERASDAQAGSASGLAATAVATEWAARGGQETNVMAADRSAGTTPERAAAAATPASAPATSAAAAAATTASSAAAAMDLDRASVRASSGGYAPERVSAGAGSGQLFLSEHASLVARPSTSSLTESIDLATARCEPANATNKKVLFLEATN